MMKTLAFALCLSLLTAVTASAQCEAPRYRRFQATTSKTGGSMNLSLRPDDVTLEKLVCLAQTLRKERASWSSMSVQIFASEDAAKGFVSANGGTGGSYLRDLRAQVDFANGGLSLTITPIGHAYPYFVPTTLGSLGATVYNTRIELPVRGAVRCRLELTGRCVLALDPPVYPKEALSAHASGKVILAGTTSRDGKVTVTVDAREGREGNEMDALVRAAVENLKSWWLEPIRRQDTFRITYLYVIDPAFRPGQLDVKFDLPNEIRIRSN